MSKSPRQSDSSSRGSVDYATAVAILLAVAVVTSTAIGGLSLASTVASAGSADQGYSTLQVSQTKGAGDDRIVGVDWSFKSNVSAAKLVINITDSSGNTIATTKGANPKTVIDPANDSSTNITFLQNNLNKAAKIRITQVLENDTYYQCTADYNPPLGRGDFSCQLTSIATEPALTTSSGDTAFTGGGSAVTVDGNLTITSSEFSSFSGATVSITDGFDPETDALSYDPSVIPTDADGNPIITGSYNATNGTLTFNGTASPSTYQELLRTVTYDNPETPPTTTPRNVTFTLTTPNRTRTGVYYNPDTGHYYEYVEGSGVSWETARKRAANRSYAGVSGYVATVTSPSENAFLVDRFGAAGWLGAADTAAEGEWRWVTGPEGTEAGGAGRLFFNQTSAHVAWTDPYPAPPAGVPGGGSAVNGRYANWDTRHEPNNKFPFFGGQDYAYLCSGPGSCPTGTWKDASADSPPFTAQGYFVEYGGPNATPTQDVVNLTDSKTITVSASTSDTTSPTASAAVSSATVAPGASFTLNASASSDDSGIARYEWDVNGNGRTDLTGETNTTTLQRPGTYNVTLTVTDAGGNVDTDDIAVTVQDTTAPTPTITALNGTTVERGAPVQFTGTNSTDDIAIDGFEWDFGDGSANTSGVSPTHGFDSTGTYTVTMTVNDTSGNTNTTTVTVDITSSSRPNITGFTVSSPAEGELNVSFSSDQRLDNITVEVFNTTQLSPRADDSSAREFTLTEDAFSETFSAGTYTYTNTTSVADGNYTGRLDRAANDTTGDAGTGQSDNATVQTFAEDGVVYVKKSNKSELRAVTTNGVVIDYAIGSHTVVAVGPRADIDGDGEKEVPYINKDDGALYIVGDSDQSPQQIGNFSSLDTRNKKSRLAIGDWDADGNFDILFAGNSESDAFYRVDWDERNSTPERIAANTGGNTVQGIPASTDVDGDGARDVILNIASTGTVYYYFSDGESKKLAGGSSIFGENNNEGVGEPANMNASGGSTPGPRDFRFPVVDGNKDVGVANPNGTSRQRTTIESTITGAKTPLAAADFSGDGVDDLVYVVYDNQSVRWIALSGTPDAGQSGIVTNETGGNITAHTDIGLASRVSTFPERQNFTASPTNADDTTAPAISNLSATNPQSRDVNISFTSNESLATITLNVTNVTGSNNTVVSTLSRDDFTETTANGNYTYTNTTTVTTDGTYEANLTRAADAVGNNRITNRTDTTTISTDTTAPSIADSNVTVSNPQNRDLDVSIRSDERLSTVTLEISNVTGSNDTVVKTLSTADLTETDNGNGTYTYTNTSTAATDGTYEATLTRAEDAAGNDGASGQNDTTTVSTDTTAPRIADANVTFVNPQNRDLNVSITSDEQLTTVTVELVNVTGSNDTVVTTLTASDLTETDNGNGTYTYTNTSTVAADGTYEANLTEAKDAAGNDGANGQNDTATVSTDTTAPSIADGNVTLTNPQNRDLNLSITSDEQLAAVTVDLVNVTGGNDTVVRTLTLSDLTETDNGNGTYTYTNTSTVSTDGTYEANLTQAEDAAGNDGANGQNDTATISTDTTAPSIADGNVTLTNPQGRDLNVSIRSDEQLSIITLEIANVTGSNDTVVRTLSTADLTETDNGNGTYTYTNTSTVRSDGTFEATLTRAEDAAGNDGASGQNDTATISTDGTDPSIADNNVTLTNPQGRDLNVSIRSEQLSTITLEISNVTGGNDTVVKTLAASDLTETDNGNGTYTYTNTSTVSTDGTYEVTLTRAEDAAGNDGANGQNDTATVDSIAPSIVDGNVTLVNPQNQDLNVSIRSDEQLATVTVELANVTGSNDTVVSTLTLSDLTETDNGNGTYTYANTSTVATDGTYEATLTQAADAAGNDGANGQNDTTTVSTDTTAPSVVDGNVTLTNPRNRDLNVSITSNEQLATVTVDLVNVTGSNDTVVRTLTLSDLTETDNGNGTYTYTNTSTVVADGTYEATLTQAEDAAGNDGASGQNDTATISTDTTAPSITDANVTLVNPQSRDLNVSITSDEQLATITVDLVNVTGSNDTTVRTLTLSDLSETDNGNGTYTYTNTSAVSTDGTYEATLTRAEDAAGNDGASGQNDTVTISTDATAPNVTNVSLGNDGSGALDLSFDASERLTRLTVRVDGPNTPGVYTFTAANFSVSGSGPYTYVLNTTQQFDDGDGTYTATVTNATDDDGNNGGTSGVGSGLADDYALDTTGPQRAPQNVSAVAVANGNIDVQFDDVDDQTAIYSVRRSTTSGSGYTEVRRVTDDDSATYVTTDTTATHNTTYYYVVVPIDAGDDEGFVSKEANATADGTTPQISAFAATNPSGQDIRITLNASEQLGDTDGAVNVTITGPETTALNRSDFTESVVNGTVTYTATYAASTDGTYTATLNTAEDPAGNDGASSQQSDVTVRTRLDAEAFASSYVLNVHETLILSGGDSTVPNGSSPTYTWRVDGTTSTGEQVTRQFGTPGTYTATLELTADGTTSTDTLTFTVEDNSPPGVVVGTDRTTTENTTVVFDASNTTDNVGVTSYAWDVDDDGTDEASTATTTYAYDDPGTYTATVTVTDGAGNTDTATVTVTVLGPGASATPSTLEFGAAAVGTGNTSAVQVTNTGTDDLNITGASLRGADPGAFTVPGRPAATQIAPGETTAIEAGFEPSTAGGKSATLDITTNDTDADTITVQLNGTGTSSDIGTNRSSIDYGAREVGKTVTADVEITNNGSSTATISAIGVTGRNDSQFSLAAGSPRPASLDPGETRTLTVAFTPSTTGQQVAAIEIRTPGSTASVGVSGSGTGPETGLPDIGGETVSFAETGKTNTTTESISLANYGTQQLNVSAIDITGQNASAFTVTSSPSTITAGQTRSVDVRFDPSDAGNYSATLRIDSNDPDEPTTTLTLNATAVGAKVDSSPESLHFNSTGDTLNVTVKNLASSKADLRTSRTALIGQNPEAFTIVSGSAPFTLAPGETKRIELRFSPPANATGTKEAQLRLISDAANQPQIDVWLTSAEAYVVIQPLADRYQPPNATEAVNIDANNMQSEDELLVNVSRPRTRGLPAEVRTLGMSNDTRSEYQLNVSYGSSPTDQSVPTLDASNESSVSYVELAHPNATFDNTSIDYRVAKSNVSANANPQELTLWRYNDGQWNAVNATLVRETNEYYYYQATPPGFSQFVISEPASPSPSSPSSDSPSSSDTGDDGDDTSTTTPIETATPTATPVPTATPRQIPDTTATPKQGTPTSAATPTPRADQRTTTPGDAKLIVAALEANRTSLDGPGFVRFVVTVENNAERTTRTGTVRLRIDGALVGSREVTVSPGKSTTVSFRHRLTSAGRHRAVASLNDSAQAADASRRLTTTVSLTLDDTSCRLFGINLGHFIVCWYWWVLLAIILATLETIRRRLTKDEDEDEDEHGSREWPERSGHD